MAETARFRVVTYYTPDYAGYAAGLARSLDEHMPGTPRHFEPLSPLSWKQATCLKGQFMAEQLRGSDRGVLWIDADALVRQPFKLPDVDFAVHGRFADRIRRTWSPVRTGTVYLGTGGLALAELWAQECASRSDGNDQWALWRAWLRLMGEGDGLPSTAWLSRAYCQKRGEPGARPVIEHLMASRTKRGK